WASGSTNWHASSVSISDLPGTLTDPNFPADDFRAEVKDQAWYGAIALPASPVTAVATANITDRDNRIVAFSANVSGGTSPYTYRWSFGDANSSTDANPIHTYSQGGRFPVQLIVEDSAGNRAYSIVDVLLGGPPVIAAMSISPNPNYVSQYTYLHAVADDRDGSIVNWPWHFGDGTNDSGRYVYHTFAAPGSYLVRLTVTDNAGQVAFLNQTVLVNVNQLPVARFTFYPSDPIAGQYVSFSGGASYDPDGYIIQ